MKYIIELEQIEGTELYIAKGTNTLVFDKNGIEKILKPIEEDPKCPFEKDELVEVSDDGQRWMLRYFSSKKDGRFYCYEARYTSQGVNEINRYDYCRKYGTLGGLIKEQKE